MTSKSVPFCSEHQISKEWRQADFEYSEDGITVRVSGVYAWVCPADGETSFTPDTVDELITTVRELLEAAKRSRERQSALTEYVVSVSTNDQVRLAS